MAAAAIAQTHSSRHEGGLEPGRSPQRTLGAASDAVVFFTTPYQDHPALLADTPVAGFTTDRQIGEAAGQLSGFHNCTAVVRVPPR